MAKTGFRTVSDYLATLSAEDRTAVRAICDTIAAAVPEAEELISYQIAAFRFHGFIFYVAATKNHYAISCPPPFTVFEAFGSQLAPYDRSKTTVRFPKDQPIPHALIADMARFRAREKLEKAAQKPKR